MMQSEYFSEIEKLHREREIRMAIEDASLTMINEIINTVENIRNVHIAMTKGDILDAIKKYMERVKVAKA